MSFWKASPLSPVNKLSDLLSSQKTICWRAYPLRLDECVHAGVKAAFAGHSVKTVAEIGWRSSKDRTLLIYAQEHFDVFLTIDQRLERQLKLQEFKLGFVLARVPNNEIVSYKPIFAELLKAAETVKLGEVRFVVSPQFRG